MVDNTQHLTDVYISVDVETAGPYPEEYSLLSIGACTVEEDPKTFYIEIKPFNDRMTREAFDVHHLDLGSLAEKGADPAEAMHRFAAWVEKQAGEGKRPVFVAFNAPFDWMFVNTYFHRFLGKNPFGHSALDIKSFFMGLHHVSWHETSMKHINSHYKKAKELTHNALDDALDQARIFLAMIEESKTKEEHSHE